MFKPYKLLLGVIIAFAITSCQSGAHSSVTPVELDIAIDANQETKLKQDVEGTAFSALHDIILAEDFVWNDLYEFQLNELKEMQDDAEYPNAQWASIDFLVRNTPFLEEATMAELEAQLQLVMSRGHSNNLFVPHALLSAPAMELSPTQKSGYAEKIIAQYQSHYTDQYREDFEERNQKELAGLHKLLLSK